MDFEFGGKIIFLFQIPNPKSQIPNIFRNFAVMKIFSNDQIKSIIQSTIENDGVEVQELIERAATGIAAEISDRWDPKRRMVVFAGWGGNGADTLAACRLLMRQGYNPEIFLFNIGGRRLSQVCQNFRDQLLEEFPEAQLTEITQQFNIPELERNCVVVDGLFGSGLERSLPPSFSVLIRTINESNADIVAIDLPSGLFPDVNTNSINNNIIHATLTLAIGFPHLPYYIDDYAELVGECVTIDLNLSREAMRRTPYTFYLITRKDVARILRPRWPEYTKKDYGSALIVAGSFGMMGAAVLATRGCLRAGVGKVTCYSPRCGLYVMQTAVPSALFMRDTHDVAISEISPKYNYNAIAIGPGIGTAEVTINALENYLKIANANSKPLALDADALNCIALRPMMLNYLPVYSVLTPHEREFDRLFGEQPSDEARLRTAMEKANFYNIIIVLKGRYTAIVRPDGKVHINSSGSPALATAGSGDVLTGVIAGLIAQGYPPETAAIIGVYVHGLSGEICAEDQGTYGTIADDIADNIGRAIRKIMNNE